MSDAVKKALDHAATRRPLIDSLDDKVSAAIINIETAMRRHFSVRIEVDIGDGDALAFGKHGGKWCLIWCHGEDETPLVSAPRDIRSEALALGQIDKLLVASVDQLDEDIKQRELALAQADWLIEALGGEQK